MSISSRGLPFVFLVMFVSDFIFYVYPYSKTENNEILAFALDRQKDWPPGSVIAYSSLVDEQCAARIAAVRGLADAQCRLPRHAYTFLLLWSLRRFKTGQIRAEVRAQISRVLEAGIKPSHLDSHQHLHLFPPILTTVLEEATKAGIPVIRLTDDRSQGRGIKGAILARLSGRAQPRLCAFGIRSADHFWGLSHSGRMGETSLVRVLARLKNGVNELMCHPGFSDPATRARYPWRYHWDEETLALTSATIQAYIHGHNIRLANFRDAW
jgi:predicted glycoside hydrolase/deacetylase ChbG (UPF0249 family)